MASILSTIIKHLVLASLLGEGIYSQFVTTNGVNFENDGALFNYAGTNVYDAALQSDQYATDVVNAVVANGYKVLRCWAFLDYDTTTGSTPGVYYQSWANSQPTINTGPNGLGLLDQVVSQAERTGLKLILTMVNNWDNYGGMDVYVNNVVGSGAYHDDFYTNQQINTYYQNYVQAVVSRYSSSPSIFAWELANEPRCAGSGPNAQSPDGCSAAVITSWVDTMTTFIKSIDPNHMVTFGMEGFFNRPATANSVYEYDGASGQDYDAVMALPNVDFGTIHLYFSSSSGESYADIPWTLQFLEDHDNCSMTVNKPSILEEYGVPSNDPVYSRQDVYDQWHAYMMSSPGINGDMTWGSLMVDTDCPGTNVYAICPTDPDYADLVTNWVPQMNGKA